jgi:hypothetical protein
VSNPQSIDAKDSQKALLISERDSHVFEDRPHRSYFDEDQGHVIGGGTIAPSRHAIKDLLLHLRQRQSGRFTRNLGETLDAEHLTPGIEIVREAIRV